MASAAETMLSARGVRLTPQRVVIADYLLNTDCHPTAEQVLESVANALPVQLSMATVYNTLNLLVESGVIQEVYTEPGGCARFDANMERHHHFVNTRDGSVHDIPFDAVPNLDKSLDAKYKVSNYTVVFYGERVDDL